MLRHSDFLDNLDSGSGATDTKFKRMSRATHLIKVVALSDLGDTRYQPKLERRSFIWNFGTLLLWSIISHYATEVGKDH
jgi:hypothetical protein